MNRPAEIILSCLGLLVLWPLLIIIAVGIKFDSKGPVFYRGNRMGRQGRIFHMVKFRTMSHDTSMTGSPITTRMDSRITRFGRFLRKAKLDELPQAFNVLKGDMAIVGPRPEDPDIASAYTPEQKAILNYRPGITSPASIVYRREEALIPDEEWKSVYLNEILPRKLRMDIEYMKTRNFLSDIHTILATFGIVKIRKQSLYET
jgi:lipopolysaccharide/colanic/teichoic acid biosynthesis glycosyltransferase